MTVFTDAKGWYPGVEYRPDLDEEEPFFFRDIDASTVVPSLDNTIYSTRVVDKNGKVLYRLFGTGLGGGHVLGSGNPTDGRPAIQDVDYGTYADLSLGVKVRILKTKKKNTAVWVRDPSGQQGHLTVRHGRAGGPGQGRAAGAGEERGGQQIRSQENRSVTAVSVNPGS